MDAQVLTEERLKAARRRIQRSRSELERAVEQAKRVARAAHGNGVPKSTIARELGITRPTLDAWLSQ